MCYFEQLFMRPQFHEAAAPVLVLPLNCCLFQSSAAAPMAPGSPFHWIIGSRAAVVKVQKLCSDQDA